MKSVQSQRRLVWDTARLSALLSAVPRICCPVMTNDGAFASFDHRPIELVLGPPDGIPRGFCWDGKLIVLPPEAWEKSYSQQLKPQKDNRGAEFVGILLEPGELEAFESKLIRDRSLPEGRAIEEYLTRILYRGVTPWSSSRSESVLGSYFKDVKVSDGKATKGQTGVMPVSENEATLIWTAQNREMTSELLMGCGFDIPVDEPAPLDGGQIEALCGKMLLALRAVGRGYVGKKEHVGFASGRRLVEHLSGLKRVPPNQLHASSLPSSSRLPSPPRRFRDVNNNFI